MADLNCQAGQGKMAQHRFWARCGFYRSGWGEVKEISTRMVVSDRGGAVLEHENLC
jgi:hypothetical protein